MNKRKIEPTKEAENIQKVDEKVNDKTKPVLYPINSTITFYMPDTNTLGKLVKAKKGVELTSKYMTVQDWEARMGDPLYCFFSGMKDSVNTDGNYYQIARLVNMKGEPFVCAQNSLVDALRGLELGQGVEITCVDVVDKELPNKEVIRVAHFKVIVLEINMLDHVNKK